MIKILNNIKNIIYAYEKLFSWQFLLNLCFKLNYLKYVYRICFIYLYYLIQ